MSRPIPISPHPFSVVAAPSCSRPQLPVHDVREDALRVRALMGESGVAGFTEISHGAIKALFRSLFGHRLGVKASDCPIVWTPDWRKVEGGVELGARGIPVVAPARKTVWVVLERGGYRLGVVSVHMHPGGFARHPSRAQRLARRLIRSLWLQHSRRIQRRLNTLVATCDAVVMVGDINKPGTTTWHPLIRATKPGLLYVGGWAKDENTTSTTARLHKQHADHQAAVVTITPKERP